MRRKKLYRRLVHEFPEQMYDPGSHDEPFRAWIDRLRGQKKVILEIGTGTGEFLASQALAHPDCFFLGVEVKADRIFKAYSTAQMKGLRNMAFLKTEAIRLAELNLPDVEKIYLLFSDPWPKKRHILRRLTSELYLPYYEDLLVSEGEIILKTDNKELFDYSITSLKSRHWQIIEKDLHFKTVLEEQTQFEKRFVSSDMPIFYLKARHPARKD